jgi:hypothetical protein
MRLPVTLFASSFAIVVAAGLVQLDAGPEADGPATRPALHELTIGDHTLELGLDRERVPTGEAIRLSIVGREGRGAGDKLRVALLEQTGSPMSRSMAPPREVFHQDVVVARDGALSLPIKLAGAAARRPKGAPTVDPLLTAGRATQYTIVVSAAGGGGPGDAAIYLPVFAYEPEAYKLEVEPVVAGAPGTAIDVAVKVTSLVDAPLRGITVGGSSELASIGQPATIAELAPRASVTVHLKGTRVAAAEGPAMVQAYGYAELGGTAAAWARFADDGTLVARASEAAMPAFMLGP